MADHHQHARIFSRSSGGEIRFQGKWASVRVAQSVAKEVATRARIEKLDNRKAIRSGGSAGSVAVATLHGRPQRVLRGFQAAPAASTGSGVLGSASFWVAISSSACALAAAAWFGAFGPLPAWAWTRSPTVERHVVPSIPTEAETAAALGYSTAASYRADQSLASATLRSIMTSSAGTQQIWENRETGSRGLLQVEGSLLRGDGSDCRKFRQRLLLNGKLRENNVIACRTFDEREWSHDLAWGGTVVVQLPLRGS